MQSDSQRRPRVLGALFYPRFLLAMAIVLVVIVVMFKARRQIGMRALRGVVGQRMHRDVVGKLPDGLHVVLAGTDSPMPDAKRIGVYTFVKAGKHIFIVDSGPGSTLKLELMRVPLGKIEAVLLTHFQAHRLLPSHPAGAGAPLTRRFSRRLEEILPGAHHHWGGGDAL